MPKTINYKDKDGNLIASVILPDTDTKKAWKVVKRTVDDLFFLFDEDKEKGGKK